MTKRSILFVLTLWTGLVASAQVSASLSVTQPPAVLSEWVTRPSFTYIVNKLDSGSQLVLIKAELKLADGTVIGTKDLAKSTVIPLQRGTRVFLARDVFPLDIVVFLGSYKNSVERTGKLPAGTYQMSVQLLSAATLSPITPVQSKFFSVVAPQLPFLISPANQSTLDAKTAETAILFRWTPAVPAQAVSYRLQVFELLPAQVPLQALRGNMPLVDQVLKAQTQFTWRPQMPFSVDSIPRRFIWTIQALDMNQQPLIQTGSNGEGRSEPFIFSVARPAMKARD